MARDNFSDLIAFVAVAKERSFTRAAAQLGLSQSALSHTIRALETRMQLRLLTRTTRSVSLTEAGARLLQTVAPRFEEIEAEIAVLSELSAKPAGTIRITSTDYAAKSILWPKLSPLLKTYPDVKLEITVDYGLTDIVAGSYDIGVRLGDQVAKDMIAVRIAPDLRMRIVGSPEYLKKRPAPKTPQALASHSCINLRLPTYGGLYAWELKKGKREIQARVDGQLTFNNSYQILDAALDDFGLACIPEDLAAPHVAAGRLTWVLEDWSPTFPGMHIYYASRRQPSKALTLVVDALRYKPALPGNSLAL